MFGRKKKKSEPEPIIFHGGPWDGYYTTVVAEPPMEIFVLGRSYGPGWRHCYVVLRRNGHWRAVYAGVHLRATKHAKKPS